MRIGRWLLGAALVLVVAGVVVARIRWEAAGEAREISPPIGAQSLEQYGSDVQDRAGLVALDLRNDRGPATVRTYALPPNSPWLQSRMIVATQLDHWEQTTDCVDEPSARLLECTWREPTRWWPRTVRLTMMRPPPSSGTEPTFVIIGSGPGE